MKKKNRKGVILMAALLSLLVLFVLTACTQDEPDPAPEPEPIDGGTTTYIDANAPKVIESKDITAFSLNCYLSNRWRGDEEGMCPVCHTRLLQVSHDKKPWTVSCAAATAP